MAFSWRYENQDGELAGTSAEFAEREAAEAWIGEAFDDLLEQGIEQVNLFDGDELVYGPMSLRPE